MQPTGTRWKAAQGSAVRSAGGDRGSGGTGSVQRGSIRPSKLHDGGKGQNPVYALQDLLNGAGTWGTALSICATTQLSVNPPHTYTVLYPCFCYLSFLASRDLECGDTSIVNYRVP